MLLHLFLILAFWELTHNNVHTHDHSMKGTIAIFNSLQALGISLIHENLSRENDVKCSYFIEKTQLFVIGSINLCLFYNNITK